MCTNDERHDAMTSTHLTAVGLFLRKGFSQGKRVEKFCKHLLGSFANKRNANSLTEPYAHRKESEPSASRKPLDQVCKESFVYKKKEPCFCGGVVMFLWWCGCVGVVVWLCFCGGVVVFLWRCGYVLWWCGCAFVLVCLCFCGGAVVSL